MLFVHTVEEAYQNGELRSLKGGLHLASHVILE